MNIEVHHRSISNDLSTIHFHFFEMDKDEPIIEAKIDVNDFEKWADENGYFDWEITHYSQALNELEVITGKHTCVVEFMMESSNVNEVLYLYWKLNNSLFYQMGLTKLCEMEDALSQFGKIFKP